MIDTTSQTFLSKIDELSTGLLLDGVGDRLPEKLTELAQEAERLGLADSASQARSLVEILHTETDRERQRQLLCQGLSELQQSATGASSPSAPTSFSADPELTTDFLVEAREHLASIESRMLELERSPESAEGLNSVFRTFHTIKGVAGFLGFETIQLVSHEVETLLDRARNRQLQVTSPVVDVVLECADVLKSELDQVERQLHGQTHESTADVSALLATLRQVGERCTEEPPQASGELPATAGEAERPQEKQPEAPVRQMDFTSVRVDTSKLDHLLNMVGEMVIAQSLIRNNPVLAASKDERLVADIAQLSRNTAEVQRTTMSMRMIPVGQLFQRTARLVRDLARKAGKEIILETSGEETEVDKSIAEELADPLLHMVRNSVDHGIESPDERKAAGKAAQARISLRAFHQSGLIVIEIADDGRGLNREKILAKAVERGVIEAEAQPTDSEVWQLIFEPGFSTAEKVTEVSGRGVGMDVVRRNVQKLRGRIDIHSVVGKGASFLLKLPLTLAIIDGLVVLVGSSRYVVPLASVQEILRPAEGVISTVQGRDEMALVRGSLLPIIRLHRKFGVESSAADTGLLVVVESEDRRCCLMVDDLLGKQEVVIKSLGETFKDVSGVSGCAILGDGRVGLILDIAGICFRGTR